MICFYFSNILRDVRKHKVETVVLILLTAILLGSVGGVFQSITESGTKEKIVSRYMWNQEEVYRTLETLDDVNFYRYTREKFHFDDLKKFVNDLYQSNDFKFITQIEQQGIVIYDQEVPEVALFGYEFGYGADSKQEYCGHLAQDMEAIITSIQFFEENDIKIYEGRSLGEEDYYLQKNKPIPILLGHDYSGYFNVGDIISGEYFAEETLFEVVGFVEQNSFFFSSTSCELESTNKYIIAPAILEFEDSSLEYIGSILLQSVVGLLKTSTGGDKLAADYNKVKEDNHLQEFGINMKVENLAADYSDYIQSISQMTKLVTRQYVVLLIILVTLTVVSISLILKEHLNENMQRYRIQILCGSNASFILYEILLQIVCVIVCGDIISILMILGDLIRFSTKDRIACIGIIQLVVMFLIGCIFINVCVQVKKFMKKCV